MAGELSPIVDQLLQEYQADQLNSLGLDNEADV
jgi:hypothetical protein